MAFFHLTDENHESHENPKLIRNAEFRIFRNFGGGTRINGIYIILKCLHVFRVHGTSEGEKKHTEMEKDMNSFCTLNGMQSGMHGSSYFLLFL